MRISRRKHWNAAAQSNTISRNWTQRRRMMNHENGWKAAVRSATTRGGRGESDDEEERVAFLIGEWADFSTPSKTSRQEPRTLPALPRSTKNWKVKTLFSDTDVGCTWNILRFSISKTVAVRSIFFRPPARCNLLCTRLNDKKLSRCMWRIGHEMRSFNSFSVEFQLVLVYRANLDSKTFARRI